MNHSSTFLVLAALLGVVAAFGGCSSSPASSAPNGSTGVGGHGPGDTPTTGGVSADAPEAGGAPSQTYGGATDQGGSIGTGATGTGGSGNGPGGTAGSGPSDQGGSPTRDLGDGGEPGQGGGDSHDVGRGGTGNTQDVAGGTGNTEDRAGGTGNTEDRAGGTGNTTDHTGGVGGPPRPPDSGTPHCIPTYFAEKVNVLVLGDANVTNADTRGALWVGGNLTGTVGCYDVGADLPPDPNCTRYDLAVGGTAKVACVQLMNGAAAFGTPFTGTLSGAHCGAFTNPPDMPNFGQIATEVKQDSAYFAGLPANGSTNGTVLDGSTAACKVVVFNTSLCEFAGVTIKIPAGGTAIVNSSCLSPTFTHGQTSIEMGGVTQAQCAGSAGTGGACDRVLYNFWQATSITIQGMSVQGSLLAPYAKLTGDTNVHGEVVVGSMDTATEFHAWFFEGCLDTTSCSGH